MDRIDPDTRQTDAKGRVTLGESFANRTVIIERLDDGDVLIRPARVIPEREAWLFKNKKALGMVLRGIEGAKARKFVKGPDLKADARLAAKMRDL